MGEKKDMTGLTIGYLYVNEECGRTKGGKVLWRCTCRCGNEAIVSGVSLRRGNTVSCGCYCHQRASECNRKHGLSVEHPKLFGAIQRHFNSIVNGSRSYRRWSIDKRYTPDANGSAKFCLDLILLYPDLCKRYEVEDLVIDKDGDTDCVFRPETIKFVTRLENDNNRYNTVRLSDGTPLATFCRSVGVITSEKGKQTNTYARYGQWFRKHNGEAHPELVKAANQTILEMRQCLELLRLLDDVRAFTAQYLNR